MIVFSVLPVLLGVGQSLPPPPKVPDVVTDTPIAIDDGAYIDDPSKLEELKVSGASGDADAAFRVYAHYSSGSGNSEVESERWLEIAAENGHKVAQYNYWNDHKDSKDEVIKARADYWLCKAAAANYQAAKDELKEKKCKESH